MSAELTYVLITPYSLYKSRTGGIIARLLSLSGLEFAGAHLMAPSPEFVAEYARLIDQQDLPDRVRQKLVDYVETQLGPDNPITNRTMLLLLRGERAVARLAAVTGAISHNTTGNSIRGTYADLVADPEGSFLYFEPAVLTAPDSALNRKHLALLAEYASRDGGVLEHALHFDDTPACETTLVLLKPENFVKPSARPGNIIDIFAQTGLCIVGAKLVQMTVGQGKEFYGPLRSIFVKKLKEPLAKRIAAAVADTLGFPVTEAEFLAMADVLTDRFAETEFNRIVEFMTGVHPDTVGGDDDTHGDVRSLGLLYRGEDAIHKIRASLGATDPKRAAAGTVRSDYATDLMKNGAHASDSPENAERERRIVGLWDNGETCNVERAIRAYLSATP